MEEESEEAVTYSLVGGNLEETVQVREEPFEMSFHMHTVHS